MLTFLFVGGVVVFASEALGFEIIFEPVDTLAFPGDDASLYVGALGSSDIEVQWFKDDIPLDGANQELLQLQEVNASHEGAYYALLKDGEHTLHSRAATLSLKPATSETPWITRLTTPLLDAFFLPGNKWLACQSINGIELRNVENDQLLTTMSEEMFYDIIPENFHRYIDQYHQLLPVDGVLKSENGKYWLGGLPGPSIGGVVLSDRLWEIAELVSGISFRGGVFSSDSQYVITSHAQWDPNDPHTHLWNLKNGSHIRSFTPHSQYLHSMSISPDSSLMVSSGVLKEVFAEIGNVYVSRISDGSLLYRVGRNGQFSIYALPWFQRITANWIIANEKQFFSTTDVALDRSFSLSRPFFFDDETDSYLNGKWDGDGLQRIVIGRLADLTERASLPHLLTSVGAYAVTPDFSKVALGIKMDEMNLIELWDLEELRLIRKFKGHEAEINELKISKDGSMLFSADQNGFVNTWRGDERFEISDIAKVYAESELFRLKRPVRSILDFSDDLDLLSVAVWIDDVNLVQVWDLKKSKLQHQFKFEDSTMRNAKLSNDGNHFLFVGFKGDGNGGYMELWRLIDGKRLKVFRNQSSFFSPLGAIYPGIFNYSNFTTDDHYIEAIDTNWVKYRWQVADDPVLPQPHLDMFASGVLVVDRVVVDTYLRLWYSVDVNDWSQSVLVDSIQVENSDPVQFSLPAPFQGKRGFYRVEVSSHPISP